MQLVVVDHCFKGEFCINSLEKAVNYTFLEKQTLNHTIIVNFLSVSLIFKTICGMALGNMINCLATYSPTYLSYSHETFDQTSVLFQSCSQALPYATPEVHFDQALLVFKRTLIEVIL